MTDASFAANAWPIGRPRSLPACRRRSVLSLALAAVVPGVMAADPTPIEMWKSPACGCCGEWVSHLHSMGFKVTVHDTGSNAARQRLRMPDALASCHTAVVDGYAIEGHVPAQEIRRLLRERTRALGLAVPGMKLGSPGMDGPQYGGRRQPYDVVLVRADGGTAVYQSY